MGRRAGFVVIGLGLLLTSCSGPSIADRPDKPLGFLVERDLPYTSQLSVDVYYPDAEGLWPVAVVLHGGEDHKETMYGFGRFAAKQGVVVFVPEWRSFPAQLESNPLVALEDVTCAVRFARDRASEYGGEGGQIVAAGWSLGANFGAIAVLRDDPVGGDCVVGAEVSAAVEGFVGLDGVYNVAELLDEPTAWTDDQIDQMSAHSYVRSFQGDEPPEFRLFTGQVEELNAQAERFRDELRQAGYNVDLVRHADRSHMGVILAPGTVDALVDLAFE